MDWILPLVAGILILFGTGLGLYITFKVNSLSNDKQKKIEELNIEINEAIKNNQLLSKQILDISNNLKDVSSEIQELAKKNVDLTDKGLSLTEKSIELSEIIQNIQTGGDSYPIIELMSYVNSNILELHVINKGKYVIRSASIKVVDYVKRNVLSKQLKKGDNAWEKAILPSITNHKIGSLIPNVFYKIKVIDLKYNIVYLTMQIFTENGVFFQTTKWVDALGDRKVYTKLEDKNHNIIYEKYSPDFPRKEDGSLDIGFSGL